MENDETIPEPGSTGNRNAKFPLTRWSLVLQLEDPCDQQRAKALSELCELYWYPLYAYVRRRGYSAHDAEDMTQGFFSRLLSRNDLEKANPEKGRLRTYLLTAMKYYLAKEWHKENTLKRGGGYTILSFQVDEAEQRYRLEPVDHETPETLFQQRWATTVLENVLESLKIEYHSRGRGDLFNTLKPYLTKQSKDERYTELGKKVGMTETAIKVTIFRMRKRFQELLREQISHTVESRSEVEDEITYLFQVFDT